MAHNVSNEYKQVIYSQQAKNKIKILFNNVELQDADRYCERLTIKSRIVPNGAKIFNLNNFISKEAELILHDIDTSIIQDQVSISIGTLVGNSYEYVPIGIFNIQDQPTNDKNKTTIKLRDNSVKFDFNYNAQPLIEENGGSATKLQILHDICSKVGVTCDISSFIGYIDDIGVYDNTITAREYISRIAEQAGRIATINRSGELIFVDLNNLTTWEIPIEIVEKYENGTKYKIGRVVYEDGIVRYETPTSNDDTLFLDGSNNYINGELVKEQANSNNNHYYLENTGDSELAYLELEGKTTQETRSGKNLLKNTNVNSGDNNYWSGYSTFNEPTRTLTRSTTATTESYISHRLNGLKSNATYTLSLYAKSNGYVRSMDLYCYNQNTQGIKTRNAITLTTEFVKYTFTFTTASDVTYGANSMIRIDNNGSTQDGTEAILTVKDVMLVEGTDTEYEDYGISPSPDYPSEIVSVAYENLLPSNNTSQTINGLTITHNEDGSILINGTATANSFYRINTNNITLPSGTYTFSIEHSMPSGTQISYWREQGTVVATLSGSYGTFVASTDYELFRIIFSYNIGAIFNNFLIKPMLEKGTKPHSYIPYSKYGIEVKTTGKNLFEPIYQINDTSIACVNATLVLDEDTFKLTATGKDMYFGQVRGKGQTYTEALGNLIDVSKYSAITFYNTNPIITANYITSYDENKVSLGYQPFYSQSSTYVIPSNVKYISYRFGYAGAVSGTTYENKVIIEANNKSTGYEKYKENTYLYVLDNPLRSNKDGTVKDLAYIKNGMLYVDRKIGRIVYNGTESGWNINTSSNVLYKPIPDKITSKSGLFSNYYKYTTTSWNLADNNTISEQENNYYIFIKNTNIASVAAWQTWLSTHNVEVQYVLATPYTEELGEVQMPSTYESTTHINIDSNIDTNTYIQYKENKTQLEAILQNTNQFSIDSLKTGKILGNPAIDSYDLIQIHDKSRNLFDFSIWKNVTLNRGSSSATIDTSNNILTINNLLGEDVFTNSGMTIAGQTIVNEYRKYLIPVKPNTKYTISFVTSGTPSNSGSVNSSYYSLINENFVVNFAGAFGSIKVPEYHKWTLTTNETTKYLGIRFGCRTEKVTISYSNIQIEEGTIATDYIQFKDETYKTLATNDLVYTGVLTNTFDTQIGEEAKEQNVFINGEDTFQKWARTKIDSVEGSITLQAGQINEANGRINTTNLTIDSQGALLNVLANNSNIDVQYDSAGNPLSGEVREVTTTTGFKFNAEGMTIEDTSSNFKAQHRNTGTYYKDGDTIVGQYTKDGSKQKDLELFGVYTYGKNDIDDTPMFIAQLFTDGNGEECFGHFYNRGD